MYTDAGRNWAKTREHENVLPDVLRAGLKVVFCGMAAGRTSAEHGAYYAGRGNRFWQTLHEIGLTARQLRPEEFRCVAGYCIGLTDLVKAQSGSDSRIVPTQRDVDALRARIEHYAPRVLALNGKNAGKTFLGRPVDYGRQPELVGSTIVYVLPSTSLLAKRYWDVRHWEEVARLVGDPGS